MRQIILYFFCFFKIIYSHAQASPDSLIYLYFPSDRYNISQEHKTLIDPVLSTKKFKVIGIKGYADSTGNVSYNLELSKKRAYSVYHYFGERDGIDTVITPEYFGESQAGSKDPSKDRKVEIVLRSTGFQEQITRDSTVVTKKFELTTLYFVPDKPIIESFSLPALDEIAVVLKNYPDCLFEINGHVNYVLPESLKNKPGNLESVQKLSEERAKAVYDLLVDRGIPPQSMKYIGAGNSQMYFKKPVNDEQKRKNMRVEITVFCDRE